MRNTEKYLRLLLRIVGASAILAIVAVIMPHSWLVYWVNLAEPGTSVRVLIPYLARLLSAYYVLLGVLLVFFASDVRRYILSDAIFGVVFAVAMLILERRVSAE